MGKMKIQIPYDKQELQIALIVLDGKFTPEDMEKKMKEIISEMLDMAIKDNKSLKEKIAGYHSITVGELVGSVNYQILCEEYYKMVPIKHINKLKEKFDITEKEAWAMFASLLGLLD